MAIILMFEDSTTYPAVKMTAQKMVIGRSSKCDVQLNDPMCSARHASIEINAEGNVILSDLDSTNGTYLNESVLTTTMRVYIDDVIRIGDTRFWLDKDALNPREAKILGAGSNKTSFTQIELPGVSKPGPELTLAKPKPSKIPSRSSRPKSPIPKREEPKDSGGLIGKLKSVFGGGDDND